MVGFYLIPAYIAHRMSKDNVKMVVYNVQKLECGSEIDREKNLLLYIIADFSV